MRNAIHKTVSLNEADWSKILLPNTHSCGYATPPNPPVSNGQTAALGQIVLANFANQNGLVDLGNNQYGATAASGVAQISTPGSTNHGTLQGGAVENSNVDLTSELVDLITAQRNYQANAQTIKTQQAVDNTLINL